MRPQKLVPLDGLALAESALPPATAVAQSARGLTRVRVVPPPVGGNPVGGLAPRSDPVAARQLADRAGGTGDLPLVAGHLPGPGPPAIREGDPATMIVAYALKHPHVPVIGRGTPGRHGMPPGASTDPGTFAWLTADLRPAVRLLAEHVTASEPKAMILSFFRRQPRTALTCGDLAAYVDLPLTTVATALAEWTATGLIEGLPAGELFFYRLTDDPAHLQALAELVAWREHWVDSLGRVAHAVDPRLHAPRVRHGHLVPGVPGNEGV